MNLCDELTIRMLGLQERLLNYNRLSMRKRKRISTVLFR